MKDDLKNLNVRVAADVLRKIQMETMFANVTQQHFAERVFVRFLGLPKEKRREILGEEAGR